VISAQDAVRSFHRDLAMMRVLRALSMSFVAIALIAGLIADMSGVAAVFALAVAAGWVLLHHRSMKLARDAAASAHFVETGQLTRAEECLRAMFDARGVVRASKAAAMLQLAQLRAVQGSWADCAILCQAVIENEPGTSQAARSLRLLLLEAHVRTGNFAAAYATLNWLYNQRLNLEQSLRLLCLQTEYESRVGAHERALLAVSRKIPLIELMPAEMSGQTQAWLARSATMVGRMGLSDWLARRAALLVDARELVGVHPELRVAFPGP
jgi:hypothetical protein